MPRAKKKRAYNKKSNKILLPQTAKEFDALVKTLVTKYKLPTSDHAAAVVANRIMHLPPEQAYTTLEHLGECVLKNVAYQVAKSKGSMIQHKMQVDMIAAELKNNPLNQEAWDALESAVKEGSAYAKTVQDKCLGSKPTPILTLAKSSVGEETAPPVAVSEQA